MIPRLLEKNIKNSLFKGKTIILYGARQVGKTTLVQELLKEFGEKGRYLNCELLSVEQNLNDPDPEKLSTFFGKYKLIVLDEAQNIQNTGKILKVITDNLKGIQVIATGSSSFELASKSTEPMTGRVIHYVLYPFSTLELKEYEDWLSVSSKMENLLRFGSYPDIYRRDEDDAMKRLSEIASSYLFKDFLKFEGIQKSSLIKNLVLSLSLQIGN